MTMKSNLLRLPINLIYSNSTPSRNIKLCNEKKNHVLEIHFFFFTPRSRKDKKSDRKMSLILSYCSMNVKSQYISFVGFCIFTTYSRSFKHCRRRWLSNSFAERARDVVRVNVSEQSTLSQHLLCRLHMTCRVAMNILLHDNFT